MKLKIAVFSLLFISMVASIAAGEQNASESSNNWRGPYAGISIGYINGDTAPDVKVKEKGYFVNDDPGQLNPLASKGLDANDFLGALLLGYSFQRGPVVIGLEADFSLMDYKEQNSTGNINYITSPTNTFSITTKVETRWAANLRMRLGYVWKNSLFFITGGPSWTELDYSFLFTDTFTPESSRVNTDKLKLGWTAGFGYEKKFKKHWSVRAEWLYAEFNDIIETQSPLATHTADGFTHQVDHETRALRLCIIRSF